MFKPKQILADLNCEEFLEVKGFVSCYRGHFRVFTVLEDACLEFIAAWLYKIGHPANFYLILDTAN